MYKQINACKMSSSTFNVVYITIDIEYKSNMFKLNSICSTLVQTNVTYVSVLSSDELNVTPYN